MYIDIDSILQISNADQPNLFVLCFLENTSKVSFITVALLCNGQVRRLKRSVFVLNNNVATNANDLRLASFNVVLQILGVFLRILNSDQSML